MTNVVKNDSRGYGYTYASLADIANQGFEIPKMMTGTEGDREYIYWFDKELNQWLRGAEIVLIESKGMNQAQIYGSALTYARRYTALMALSLACDDDVQVENTNKDGTKKGEAIKDHPKKEDSGEILTESQKTVILKLSPEQIKNVLDHFNVNAVSELTKAQASETIRALVKKSEK